MLKLLAFAAIGGGIALLSSGFLFNAPKATSGEDQQKSVSTLLTSSTYAIGTNSASAKVKAVYFQMTSYFDTKEEYFVLRGPATLGQLMSDVVAKHPVISGMVPSMMVLVDGRPANSGTPLNDGDEVDFIPTISGG